MAKEIEQKSKNKFDKLINYTQVYDGNPNTYQLLVNTVAYVYNMDPLDYRVAWMADKTSPITAQQIPPLSLNFFFRDGVTVLSSLTLGRKPAEDSNLLQRGRHD